MQETFRLTQYAKGAGCGCKIAPAVLQEILKTSLPVTSYKNLLVGNGHNDDAAVYDLGNGSALIATTDFFTPIVDDAFQFGRIAAANALSDVYAMGGSPIMALAQLGWPVEVLPASLAQQVLDGARSMCEEAGVPLAGGHSIDSSEPIFGLCVNGLVQIEQLKKNMGAAVGDYLFLTKPLGIGIFSTAQKKGLLKEEDAKELLKYTTTLNKFGMEAAKLSSVTAMTDVTGFGLLGHAMEMANAANLSAEIYYNDVPKLPGVKEYIALKAVPDACFRNWNGYSKDTGFAAGVDVMEAFSLLPDPQTNGGLLIAVQPSGLEEFIDLLSKAGLDAHVKPIGKMVDKREKTIWVQAAQAEI